jgi:hypothetical protein
MMSLWGAVENQLSEVGQDGILRPSGTRPSSGVFPFGGPRGDADRMRPARDSEYAGGWRSGRITNPPQDAIPMSLTLPERWDSALIVGRTPWSARDALVPLLPRRIGHLRSLRSRPGGRLRTRASAPPSDADGRTWQSEWHWDAILPHFDTVATHRGEAQ